MNLIDDSVFQVNENFDLNVIEVGNCKNKIVVVDNFLSYPEKFKDMLESIPFQDTIKENQMPKGFYPGFQNYLNYNFGEIEQCIGFLVNQYFGYRIPFFNFSFQCVDGNKKVYNQSNYPHCDNRTIAGNIFLNTEEEIDGRSGTSFYRFKDTGEESVFANTCSYRKQRYSFTTPDLSLADFAPIEENDTYEMYHLSEMKFNRLNLYEGALFHSVFIEPGRFKKSPRKSFSFIG